jgi:hypothetical protein
MKDLSERHYTICERKPKPPGCAPSFSCSRWESLFTKVRPLQLPSETSLRSTAPSGAWYGDLGFSGESSRWCFGGELTRNSAFAILPTQREAWFAQIAFLQERLVVGWFSLKAKHVVKRSNSGGYSKANDPGRVSEECSDPGAALRLPPGYSHIVPPGTAFTRRRSSS